MEWMKNLEGVIDYIEHNLDKEISFSEAARIACCSSCYFQRIFSYVFGISLSEYIRRRKMTQAAYDLQRTNNKVIDIALKYGYSSPTSFHRAFQNVHGITPTAARTMGSILQAYPPIQFKIEITGKNSMTYRIIKKSSFYIAGMRIPITENMEENFKIVPDFWKSALQENQFAKLYRLAEQEPDKILGISLYKNPKEIYYYIGVAVNASIPAGMHSCKIPAATWVIFENNGCFKENVQNVFKRFFMEWLPLSGYKYAEFPDIEVYPICDSLSMCGHSEVWIGIKNEKEY